MRRKTNSGDRSPAADLAFRYTVATLVAARAQIVDLIAEALYQALLDNRIHVQQARTMPPDWQSLGLNQPT